MVKLLELFKGTGSFGKAAAKKGWKVTSLDNEAKYNPDILVDITKWDYKNLGFIPDVITASPPCATFTNMALTGRKVFDPSKPARVRNKDTMKPLNDYGRLGDRILKKTIEIINYFRNKNPRLKWVMENPRGSMHRSPLMAALKPYETSITYYCQYGDKRQKRTQFFNNFDLKLREGRCNARVQLTSLPLCERYKIPQPLINSIFKQITDNKIKK